MLAIRIATTKSTTTMTTILTQFLLIRGVLQQTAKAIGCLGGERRGTGGRGSYSGFTIAMPHRGSRRAAFLNGKAAYGASASGYIHREFALKQRLKNQSQRKCGLPCPSERLRLEDAA
jgi:hypothetical protein